MSHQGKDDGKIKRKVSNSSRYKATGIAAVIALVIVMGVYFSETPSSTNIVQGVECDPVEGTVFHIHAHLDIIVDGKSVTIPAGIGIKNNECLYWLHTHNTSGVIHIESPRQMTFTLAQFIHIWDNTSDISPKFGELVKNNKNLQIFVNGNKVENDPDKIELKAHDEIAIISGSVPLSIPSSYAFGGL
jgi:hypothetical protein